MRRFSVKGITGMEVRWPIQRWEIPRTVLNAGRTVMVIENELAILDIVAEYWGEEQEDVLGA